MEDLKTIVFRRMSCLSESYSEIPEDDIWDESSVIIYEKLFTLTDIILKAGLKKEYQLWEETQQKNYENEDKIK